MQDYNIYTHYECLSRLTIKKQIDNIVVCNLIDEPKVYNIFGELQYKTIITKIEKLNKWKIYL